VYIRYFWLGNQIYGVYICIYTVLANPTTTLAAHTTLYIDIIFCNALLTLFCSILQLHGSTDRSTMPCKAHSIHYIPHDNVFCDALLTLFLFKPHKHIFQQASHQCRVGSPSGVHHRECQELPMCVCVFLCVCVFVCLCMCVSFAKSKHN
jgi:hypothetical protein